MSQRLSSRPGVNPQESVPAARPRRYRISRVELLLGAVIAVVLILVGPWFVENFVEFVIPSRQSGSVAGVTTTYLFKIASFLLLVGCSFWHVSDTMRHRRDALEERERIERELRT